MMTDSQQLLADYAANGSERAFQELVARYVDLVYSTALRLVDGDTHRAKDVVQTVFVDLSRMAARLSSDCRLGGWLHRHTCFVARTVMRGERRRLARERQAMEMSALDNHPDQALAEIAPVLDEAINELGADDRDAILLRFFERRNLRSVGEALGISENVAQKRVARAVQELTTLLRRRGFVLPAAVLASGLAVGAVKAAPAGLALSIAGTVLAGAGAAGGGGLASANLALMAKLKLGIAGALVVAGVVTAVFLHSQSKAKPPEASTVVEHQPAQADSAAPNESPPASPEIAAPAPEEQPQRTPTSTAQVPEVARPMPEVVSQPVRQIVAAPEKPVADLPVLPVQQFTARPGSRVRIQGTANIIHTSWQVESRFIAGRLELGPDFPREPDQAVAPGIVDAQADAVIVVRSLKTVEPNGSHYSDHMDEIMYEHLREQQYPRIRYHLVELTFLGATNLNNVLQYQFDSRGELTVAGVTNEISMPVCVVPLGEGKLKVSGGTVLKMTSFKIAPPDVNLLVGHIRTGDDVRIQFDWVVAPKSGSSGLTQEGKVPLILDLPAPAFRGTPKNLKLGSNVEPLRDKPRPPMLVPPGLENIAPESRITCSDKNATPGALARLTDGNKDASDQNMLFLRKGRQWVQMDFGTPQQLFALVIWHAHDTPKVYHDVIVRVADDPQFEHNVRTLFNNDSDKSSGPGVGRDREYVETYEGKLINAKGITARYIRFYSNGSTDSALNEYTEIEVYGRQAQ